MGGKPRPGQKVPSQNFLLGKGGKKLAKKTTRAEKTPAQKRKRKNLVENFRKATRGSKRCRRKTKIRRISNHAPTPSLKKNLKRATKGPTPSKTESLSLEQPPPKREARDRKKENFKRRDEPQEEKRNSISSRGQGIRAN